MKSYSTGTSLTTKKPAAEDFLSNNKPAAPRFYNRLNAALSSATIYAFLIFIVLNVMLLIVYGPYHRATTKSKNADDSPAKLHQMVFSSSYESNQSGPWPWWVARAYFGSSPANTSPPDIAILGDSQANAAIIQADAVAMKRSMDCAVDRQCLTLKNSLEQELKPSVSNLHLANLSIGGAMPSDYYLMSKSLLTKSQHPKLVIITLSPRSFLDATLPAASATEIFQFFSPFVDLDNLVEHAFNNPVQKWLWLAQRKFALFACREDIDLAIREFAENCFCKLYPQKSNSLQDDSSKHQSIVQSIYASNGLVPAGSSVVGPVPLLTFLDNKKEYSRRFAEMKPETLAAQSAFFLATLKYLQEIKVPVIVINMPMLPPVKSLLPDRFWNGYHQELKNDCLATNTYWFDLDALEEFPQSEFLDYVHLNAAGGKHFINKITSFIKSDDNLRACLQ